MRGSPDRGEPTSKQPIFTKWLPVIKETLVPLGYFLSEQGEAKSSTAKYVKEENLEHNLNARRDFLLRLARQCGNSPSFGQLLPMLTQTELELVEEEVTEDMVNAVVDAFLRDNPSAEAEFADSDEYRDAALDEASRQRRELRDHSEPAGDDRVTPYEVRDHLWSVLYDAVLKQQNL